MYSTSTNLSTSGLQLRHGSRAWRSTVELLSSMRFAISLLVVVAIASVIGTVLQQGQPLNSYVDEFGPFWSAVFTRLNLFNVYSSWWFLLIMAVLVMSTTLCLARNTPRIVADLRSFKTHVREQGLRAFHEHAEAELAQPRDAVVARLRRLLADRGWRMRLQPVEGGVLVAARIGGINRLGYILTHGAFVLICIGGLLDGDMMIRLQMLLMGKQPATTNMAIADVPRENMLSARTPSYRGNVSIPEGGSSNIAVLNMSEGYVLQPLPFSIKLDKFIIDYYSTGMPKLFASKVEITDTRTGRTFPATIKVNEPLKVDGVSIFQSGFDDGGSHLQLKAWPMRGAGNRTFDINGDVGSRRPLSNGQETLTLEVAGLRVINVETLGGKGDAKKTGMLGDLEGHLGAAVRLDAADRPTNVGPAVVYRLRDAAGQAREFFNYMLPIQVGGMPMYIAGERGEAGGSYRYLRIPADADGHIDGWMNLRAALADPQVRAKAVDAYVTEALPRGSSPQLAAQLRETAARTLEMFAGVIPHDAKTGQPLLKATGGLPAVAEFIEHTVPAAQQAKAGDVFVRLLNGVLWKVWQVERAANGQPPAADDAASNRFFDAAVLALSDATLYPAPLYLQLAGFQQVQASVFQVARAPGKLVVYIGAVLLILGVFAMLYIRERRAWFLVRDAQSGTSSVLMAMSTNRRTMEFEKEFEVMRAAALGPDATPRQQES